MQLFLIRHGQSTNNALADPTQRVRDPELTEIGQQQADCAADYFAARRHLLGAGASAGHRPPLDQLYCSAMIRAVHTATPIGKALGLQPQVWIDLHEVGGIFLEREDGSGSDGFPGQTRDELLGRFPDSILPEAVTEQGWWQGGRESAEEGQARAVQLAQALKQRAGANERIGLVTHGDFMSHLLKALVGAPQSSDIYIDHRNTAISCLAFSPSGDLKVQYLNRFEHLQDDLVT